MTWNPFALPGALALLLALLTAWMIYFARPNRAQNVWLAVGLALEGIIAGLGAGIMYALRDVQFANILQFTTTAAIVVLPSAYLALLGTLDTPLSRPFRTRVGLIALGVYALAGLAVLAAIPEAFVGGYHETWYAPVEADMGTGFVIASLIHTLVSLYSLAASISAFRRARTRSARQRAGAFSIAFGVRDGLVILTTALPPAVQPFFHPEARAWDLFWSMGPSTILLVYIPIVGIGILRTQLFGVDLRLKAVMRASIVAAPILLVAALVLLVARAETPLAADAGEGWIVGWIAGVAVAVLIVALLAPTRRLATRLADLAMPDVRDTPEYRARRKLDIYRATLEALEEEGPITPEGRAELAALAARFQLPREQTAAPLPASEV